MNRERDPATPSNSFNTLNNTHKSREGYNSHATWEAPTKVVKAVFNQNSLCDFQLDVAEALILGLDTMVVARTGSGKTLP